MDQEKRRRLPLDQAESRLIDQTNLQKKKGVSFKMPGAARILPSVPLFSFLKAVPDSVSFERKRTKKEKRKAGSPQAPARSHKLQD